MTVTVYTVRDVAQAALLGGSFGFLRIPAGAKVEIRRMERADRFRVTFDVTAGWPLNPEQAAKFNAESLRRLVALTQKEPNE